jgi:DeoR family L-fucose operon activator
MCEVTEETIRKNLDRMESEGRLLLSHGGRYELRSFSGQ